MSAPSDDLGERPRLGLARVDVLARVHQLDAALVDDALDVGDRDVLVLGAQRHQQVEAGERGGAGPGRDDLDVPDLLVGEFQGIRDGRRDDDRGPVLIVVEDRDLHALAAGCARPRSIPAP